jgi:hypothetical protein
MHSVPVRRSQESIKTKHPQLLYESKLYKILQGGSACGASPPGLVILILATAALTALRERKRVGGIETRPLSFHRLRSPATNTP